MTILSTWGVRRDENRRERNMAESKLIEEYESKIKKLSDALARCKKTLKEQKKKHKYRIEQLSVDYDWLSVSNQELLVVVAKWKARARKAERRVRKFFDAAKKRCGSSGGTG